MTKSGFTLMQEGWWLVQLLLLALTTNAEDAGSGAELSKFRWKGTILWTAHIITNVFAIGNRYVSGFMLVECKFSREFNPGKKVHTTLLVQDYLRLASWSISFRKLENFQNSGMYEILVLRDYEFVPLSSATKKHCFLLCSVKKVPFTVQFWRKWDYISRR